MTLTIDLNNEMEDRLKHEAGRRGLEPKAYARQLIEAGLTVNTPPQRRANQATLDLLKQWNSEQATDDPAELARREQEIEEFKAAMNRNRRDSEGPDARLPYP